MRDYQQNKVYRWEQNHLPCGGQVELPQAQSIVNHIWDDYGLEYPPTVNRIHPNTTRWAGSASRVEINLQPVVSMKTVLHEVSHSMTSNIYGESAWHGPLFVGMYVKLLSKYLGVDQFMLLQTLAVEGVDIDINASPIFID